jgi:hypothetical protein
MADDLPTETFDAADPAAIDNAKREEKRKAREDSDVLRLIMHSKQGRAWLYRHLERCNIYGETFAPGQSDVTAFKLGQENVGKQLMLSAMDASSDLYVKMVNEQREEAKRLDEVRRTERKNREANDPSASAPQDFVADLPPPAGYPGGPPLPGKPAAPAAPKPKRGK